MTVSKLITGAMALALAASSAVPVSAGAFIPGPAPSVGAVEKVQFDNRRRVLGDEEDTDDEATPRRQRRGDEVQRRQVDRIPRGEAAPGGQPDVRVDRIPRGETPRVERRIDNDRRELRRDGERRMERREARRENRFERRGYYYYYNGHLGYREKRRGYRYYNGYWFPEAAFMLGIIIQGMNRSNPDWEDHVDWCYDRYGNRYRERDNTYISRSGYRRECISPYS